MFEEVANELGLEFVHNNGHSTDLYFPAIFASGVAFLDFDNDGDLDVYLVQGGELGTGGSSASRDHLFRADIILDETGRPLPRFVDVTDRAGAVGRGFRIGVASGDVDNDGWVDLYLANVGPNRLLHNRGDGTFEDITSASGADDPRWNTSATFFDYDQDGWLDLFVAAYVQWSSDSDRACFGPSGARDYCGPMSYPPVADRLFRNRRDRTFEDVSIKSGIGRQSSSGLGVVAADLDDDGRPDLYVTNDQRPNHLWLNAGDGSFRDEALLAGAAVDRNGRSQASMGVDAADFDGDGDRDLFLTHLYGETNTLYVNHGDGIFTDESYLSQLGPPSIPFTGFGTRFVDFDNDGWLDLFTVNGAVRHNPSISDAAISFPFMQSDQLFRNLGTGRFKEISARGGPAVTNPKVSRGSAVGDLENDGDDDLLIVDSGTSPRLLRNLVGEASHWIGIRLIGGMGRRDLLGARLEIVPESAPRRHRWVHTDGSYASASDPRVVVGLGTSTGRSTVRVRTPQGRSIEWRQLPADRYYLLIAADE